MGVAFYPVFSKLEQDWPDDINGKVLARAADCLDRVAKKANVPTLYDFYSITREDMICELLGGDPDDPATYDETKLLEEKWFDPDDGLRTLSVLIDYVERNPEAIVKQADVLDDLLAFKRHLMCAKDAGHLWHLAIDY